MSLEGRVATALDRLHPGGGLGLAVSGGGDSLALAHLAAPWAASRGVRLEAACVDHGLRRGSAAEAETAARALRALGLAATVLRWERGARRSGAGGLQAEARAARTALLADWARAAGLAAVATGHTRDDQAETVLLRLARGSGVDGLAGMAARARRGGVLWLRPLLAERRAGLRRYLRARGAEWSEDPSNDDTRFHRVRARRALAALAPLGLDAEALAATAARMGRARAGLEAATAALAGQAAHIGALGEVRIARAPLAAAPRELGLRLLARALQAASGAVYPPRLNRLEAALDAVATRAEGARTLHGCALRWRDGALLIAREPSAALRTETDALANAAPALWDGRFEIGGAACGRWRALGLEGEAALAQARRAGLWAPPAHWRAAPRPARLSAPSLWRRGQLVGAPLACYGLAPSVRRQPRVDLVGAALM